MLEFKEFEPDTMGAMEVSAPQKDKAEPFPHVLRDLGSDFFKEEDGLSTEDRDRLMKEMVQLAEEYGAEKRNIGAAEQKIKARKKDQDEKEEKLFAMFEAVGIDSFGAGAFTYFTRVDSYPSIVTEKAAFRWIKGEGFEHIIKLNVNLQTLRSMIKEVFEVTGEIPGEDDGIDIQTVNRVGVRKR